MSVKREASLSEARTKMMLHDYSQLAVWNGRGSDVMAVTWESIAKAQLCRQELTLSDAIVSARVVGLDDDLIPLIGTIANEGFVVVRRKDRELSGIITSADLSVEFETLAGPFFLLGEIERRLRRVIEGVFTPEEIREMRDVADRGRCGQSRRSELRGDCPSPRGSSTLRADWLACRPDARHRTVHRIREIRNDLMHFSPDPPDEDDRRLMRNFLMMFRTLLNG